MVKLSAYGRKEWLIIIMGFLAVLIMLIYQLVNKSVVTDSEDPEIEYAGRLMMEAKERLKSYCQTNSISINQVYDPDRTGLIGEEFTPLTTTIGDLEAKRTSAQPEFAALIVRLLKEAGVEKGDTVAIACSGSFPSLMLASLSAANAMEVHSRIMISLGSSSFGANRIDLTLLDIYRAIEAEELFQSELVGVSPGGEKDIGQGFDQELTDTLLAMIRQYGENLIFEPDLAENVIKRYNLYTNFGEITIKAFINCGGSHSSMGLSAESLRLKPGLNFTAKIPGVLSRGLIFEMISRDIPVIHLLYIKGLCIQYNIPWDPV